MTDDGSRTDGGGADTGGAGSRAGGGSSDSDSSTTDGSVDGDEETLRVDFSVPEMDCPSCAGTVERALEGVDGVASLETRPTSGTVVIAYDPERVSEERLVDAVESAGYDVESTGGDGLSLGHPAAVWRTRRAIGVWIGAGFLLVGLALDFLPVAPDPTLAAPWIYEITPSTLAYVAAVLASGLPVVRSGIASARVRSLDIDLLMGSAIVAATGIGHVVEAATLAVLYSTAELLERYTMDRTRSSLRELVELSPDTATVLRDGEEETVPADAVAVGDVVVVRPGERVPTDGVVVEGESAVDESPITGESVPVDVAEGDEVYAGSIAETGYLEVEATARAEESTIARIVELVTEAQSGQTEQEQFVDRFASYYTPLVVAGAVATAFGPPLLLGWPFGEWFVRGLTLLVIACPCAFVISTPVSVASGVTAAAKHGVLIKGGEHLEALGDVGAVAVDKTGTLTRGELAVTDVVALSDVDREHLLATVAGLEARSEHPIAEAVREHAADAGVEPVDVEEFEAIPGKGVRGDVDGTTYYAGKPGLLAERGVDLSHLHARPDGGAVDEDGAVGEGGAVAEDGAVDGDCAVDEDRAATGDASEAFRDCEREDCVDVREDVVAALQAEGKTVVLVGSADRLLGAVAIADELRPTARGTVRRLHDLGVERVVVLTGDNEGTARAVADEVGVDEYHAGLLPEEKVDAVASLREAYGSVAMVGDGINDAPSLATADVGIAMGAAGTDTAIETADVALMGDDLAGLPYCYDLAGRTTSVIRQNVWSSLGVKLLLAAGAPLGYVTIAMAVVVGDMGMSLLVTGNAMRLSRLQPEDVLADARDGDAADSSAGAPESSVDATDSSAGAPDEPGSGAGEGQSSAASADAAGDGEPAGDGAAGDGATGDASSDAASDDATVERGGAR